MRRGPIELLGIIKRCCFLLILGYWFCSTVPVVSVGVSTDTEEIYHTSHSHLRSEISANKALVESVNIGADVIDHTNDPKRGKTIDDVPHDKLGHGHLHRITNTHTLIAGKHYNIEDGIHESKDKGVDSVTSPNGGFKFVESVESGDGGFNYEQSKQISPDITGSIATKTSTLGDSLNRLKKLKYDTAADPAVVLHSVKSIAQSQKNTRDGNKEEVGLALKSIVETGNPFAKTTKDIQASDAVDISALIDENSLSLDSITKQQLAQYFPAQVIDEIVEQTQHADTVHRNLRDWTGRNVRKGTGEKKGQHDEVFAWSDDELTPLDDGTHHGLPASLNDRGVITVGDNMKRLAKLQRSGLRGFDGMDPAEVVSEVKQVLAEHLNNIIPLHQHIRNNNREEAGSEIKSMVDDASMLVDMSIELQEEKKLSSPGNSFSFDDVANDQLAQFIPAELFDNLVQHTQDIHDMLDETDLSTLSAPHSHRPLKRDRFEPQESGHVDSLFEFIGHPTFIQSVPNGKLHPNNFFTDPSSVKKFLHLNRASSGSMPKLGKYTNFHNNDIIMSKHQLRLDALGNICAHSCKLENSTCLCSRLFDCVRNMTEYDLAVIIAGGFIDTNPSSNTFGNFSVPANQLNLYNADQGVAAKLSTLKSKALGNSANTQNCNAVLGELFSACDPDESTCTNPNVQSFAVSTQEVCDVVNSNKKLLFEVIGEEFDGLADKFAKAPCKPLSYDVCAEFLVQFDMLYLGRDTGGYPLSNPMLKNPSNTVHDQGGNNKVVFDRVQFPIRYNFKQHQNTGVVMRVFSGDSTSAGPQYFYLTNPLTGKVLGLSRGSCADLTRIEVQLRIYDNGNIDSQQFSLTNDGRLESKACSNKVLSNNWNVGGIHSCRHGNELVLRPIITTDADLQRWTFVRDGSGIVNSRCGKWSGNLAISAIEDDSITKIDYTDTIPVQFINPETNMAIGLESGTCVNGRKVKLQTENGGSDQMFYLKRISDGSGEWYIESKTCDGKVLEIVGIGCGTAAEVQLYSDAFLRHTMVGECKDAQNRKYHRVRTSSNYGWDGTQIGCLNFCEDLPGFDDQVAFETWSSTQNWDTVYCYCMYDSGTVPSGTDLPTSATPITHHISPGSGPVAHGSGFSHLSCFPYNNDKRNHWKLEDGKLKSAKCKDMVMEIQSTSTLDGSGIVLAPDIEWGWNQAWSIKSNAARLLTGNGRPGQKWEAVLAQPAYDYALLPGFPGRIEGCHVQVTKFQGRVAHQQGRYFKYNPSDWETCFGLVPSGDAGISVDVKQWRNCGDLEYTGKVRVWAPFANDHGDNAIGRIDPWRSGSCCDFQDGDMLGHVDETNPPCCHVQVTVFRGIGRVALRNGRYFKYDSTAWETCFGPGPSGNAGIVVDVSQWQNCVDLKYTGKVKVWAPGANDHGDNAIGRIDPFNSGANDDFQNGDMLGHVGQTKPPCCLISRENKDIAKSAMYSCDASMSLLLGSSTSVGILSNIASLVNEKGSQYMPGTCCMDVPTNSQFFGYRYDPKLVNSAGTQMSCHHRGPWHLGISEEACKNAGGKWYRTPCITLQSCVENRPPRFDLEAPSGANCQDSLRRLNTAFVSTSTSLVNFTFGNSTTGCFKFCQSLPDYPLQIGMGIEGTESSASKCVCLYDNGKTPRKTLLPEYATRSPPIFFLTDATGKLALGLSQKMICASDEISVEFWKNEGSPRQKFQLTQDGRIVSVACPERVLTAAATVAGSRLVASPPYFNALDKSCSRICPDNSTCKYKGGGVTWDWRANCNDEGFSNIMRERDSEDNSSFDNASKNACRDALNDMVSMGIDIGFDEGTFSSRTNTKPPGCSISCNKGTLTGHFNSNAWNRINNTQTEHSEPLCQRDDYAPPINLQQLQQWIFNNESIANAVPPNLEISFMTENRQNLRSFYFALENPKSHLTIGALGTSCQDGMQLVLQKPIFGSPSQQFYIENDKIVNVMCHHLAVSIAHPKDPCRDDEELILFSKVWASNWRFSHDNETQTFESVDCLGMFIAIDSRPSNALAAFGDALSQHQFLSRLPKFDNRAESDTVNSTVTRPPKAGAAIILSNRAAHQYQSWVRKHERFQYFDGPFSFVNPTSGFAIGIEDETCAHGMMLESQKDSFRNENQQFYLGRSGSILSAKCLGLVISADIEGSCSAFNAEKSLTLHTYMITETEMKWKLKDDGSIESVKCPGVVIGSFGPAHVAFLVDRDTEDLSQIWRRQNVRLLASSNNLIVRFAKSGYTASDLQEYIGVNGDTNCFLPNTAFNRGFEDFVTNAEIAIRNAADEDQCERAREELGFEPDHPFDTEVCQTFRDFMCNPFFTGLDHVTDSLAPPPRFEEVKYKEVEYEGVEYEVPDYAEDDELPFQNIESLEQLDPIDKTKHKSLLELQKHWLNLQHALMVSHHIFDSLTFQYESCGDMPDSICLPVIMGQGGCVTNPLIYICKGVAFTLRFYSYMVVLGIDIAYEAVNHKYEIDTLGPDVQLLATDYAEATYTDLTAHNLWHYDALTKINSNIKAQHQSMRQSLQDRHFAMEMNIGQDIFDARNGLEQAIIDARNANGQGVVDAQNAISDQHNQMLRWLKRNLCLIYESSVIGGTCVTFIGPLEEGQSNIPLELHSPEGQPALVEKLQQIQAIMSEVDGTISAMNKRVKDAVVWKMDTVERKMGGKMEEVERKIDAVEEKMGGKMDAIEKKMDAVEDSVKEMKDMISKLMEMMG
mmetsp:Transcript_6098/g.13359  ORF Transcript_6098/g.13359 Transcript_6098/m.13359 type:complete len:2718 (-) Transcript_6098:69-8222(-)